MDPDVKAIVPPSLTLQEAARALRVAGRSLRKPVWLERLGAIKVGRQWLVSSEAVNEVLTGKR